MAINSGGSAYSIPVGNDAKHESLSYAAVPFHTSAPIPSNDAIPTKSWQQQRQEGMKNPETGKQKTAAEYNAGIESQRNKVLQNIGDEAIDNGPTGKKFSESLHERKNDAKFVETTKRSKPHHERED